MCPQIHILAPELNYPLLVAGVLLSYLSFTHTHTENTHIVGARYMFLSEFIIKQTHDKVL